MPSRIICFVCGSLGGEYQIHSRRRDSGAYFPFLEHHEPPKGSRIPGPDGIVDSCHVCYAFLTQQWETYEQTNTPAIKRLYWLKRLDDGPFTGAEMKLQGEYMAQVMGLQYQPSCGDNCVPLSPDDNSKVSRPDVFSNTSGGGGGKKEKKSKEYGGEGGVLDLSVPVVKQECLSRKSEKRSHHEDKEDKQHGSKFSRAKPSLDEYGFICYTCGAEMQGVVAKVISSSRRGENEPFFPFLGKITPPKGAQPINSQGMCKVCENCFSPLCHQWFSYENNGTPNSARIFKIKDSFFSNDSSIVIGSGKDAHPGVLEVCYLCSRSWPSLKMCPLYTVPDMAYEHCMYFPFVRELRRPQGARPLNPDGSVRVCIGCFGNLQIQWQRFETENVPFLQRRYSLLPTTSSSIPSTSTNPSESSVTPSSHPLDNVYPKSVTLPLKIEISKSPVPSTRISNNHLQGGGQPLPPNHPTACVPSSANQQPNFELMRQQSNDGKTSNSNMSNTTNTNTVPHPLLQAGERPKKVCYVCGEKVLASKAQILCSYPVKHEPKTAGGQQMSVPFFPFLANREPPPGSDPIMEEGTVITCSYCFYSLINQWREYEESKSEADKNCWQRKYLTCEFVCFICGLMVMRKKIRTLEVQKFPFLRDHKAPHNALVMWGGEGVAACGSCHFSLTHQYSEYERLGVPLEMRKYNWTVRDNSNDDQDSNHVILYSGNEDSNLSLDDAPGGLPPGATSSSLKPLSLATLTSGTALAASASANALAAGGKLPPKTAAVPPMNQQQMSPTNGLSASSNAAAAAAAAAAASRSTSSFAAALRKLANQAQDPLEEAISLKTSGSSPPSAHSPRATTPKRSHIHPMAFPAHTAPTSLPTPPVVTIAPTPAHHHHHHHQHHHSNNNHQHPLISSAGDTNRQTSERVSSTQSASSFDQVSKPDRDQRPLSSHSRDDDRASGKDNLLSRTPSRAHPQASAPTPTTTASSSGLGLPLTSQGLDLYARTFHPYHPDEEAALRQSLALSAYGIDPAAYAAAAAAAAAASSAYHPALVQHPAFPPGGFRLDDPLLLERYRLLQSPYFAYPPTAGGILPPHPAAPGGVGLGMHPMLAVAAAATANQRYPADLLQQHYAAYLGSPNHPLMDPRFMAQAALLERSRMEEEKLREEREKERTKELERERDREREKREKERAAERELAYRVEREREREQQQQHHQQQQQQQRLSSSEHHQHHQHHHRVNSQEMSERRDILTVPTRLPMTSERERDQRDHHRSSSQHHQQSHNLMDTHLKRSSGPSHSDGLTNHDSTPDSRDLPSHTYHHNHHHQHHPASLSKESATTAAAFHVQESLHPFKHQSLVKPPELRPSNHEHLSATKAAISSSSSSPHSSRQSHHHDIHHHHQKLLDSNSITTKSDTTSNAPNSTSTNPFSLFHPLTSHPHQHQQLLDQWSQNQSSASKLVSSYPPPPLIPNQPKEKIRKPSEHSGIFRPFDEPTSKGCSEDDSKKSSFSSSPLQQNNLPLRHQASLSASAHEKSSSQFSNSSFIKKEERFSSSSEVLSIPVLRVPPQSHITSDPYHKSNHLHSDFIPKTTTTSVSMVSKVEKKHSSSSSSSSSLLLSNNVKNRIERFDFKSLARECTSSTSSPPVVQPTVPLSSSLLSSSSSSSSSSSLMTQSLFHHPYKSFHTNSHILESTPFSLPALMESAFHEDLLQRSRRCISKLDLEEKRMKVLGRRSEESDGEMEEEEEKVTARLTMIGRVTPIPLETPNDKVNFLELVGLTTHARKKELQLKKEMRRRRLQRLASVSPVLCCSDEPALEGTSQDASNSASPFLINRLLRDCGGPRDVDELCKEMDSEEKAQFFKKLGMLPQSAAEKSDIEMKRLCAELLNAKYNKPKHQVPRDNDKTCLKRKHDVIQIQDIADKEDNTANPSLTSVTTPSSFLIPQSSYNPSVLPLTSSLPSSTVIDNSQFSSSGGKRHRPSSTSSLLSNSKKMMESRHPPISNHSFVMAGQVSMPMLTSSSTSSLSSSSSSSSVSTTPSAMRPDRLSSASSTIMPPVIFPSGNNNSIHPSFAEDFHKSVLQESFSHHQKHQHLLTQQQHQQKQQQDSTTTDIHNNCNRSANEHRHGTSSSPLSTTIKHQHLPNNHHHHHHHLAVGPSSSSSSSSSTAISSTTATINHHRDHNTTSSSSESLLKVANGAGAAVPHPSLQPLHPSPQLLSQAALAGLYPWPAGLTAMFESYQRQNGGGGGTSSAMHNGEHQASTDQARSLQPSSQHHNTTQRMNTHAAIFNEKKE